MIPKTLAKARVARLRGLPFFPTNTDGINELVEALASSCPTDAVAQAVVESFAQHGDRCPLPVDLRRQAASVREQNAEERRNCDKCGGMQFVMVYVLRTSERGPGGAAFVRNQRLTRDEYDRLDEHCPLPEGQSLLTGAAMCSCHATPQESAS